MDSTSLFGSSSGAILGTIFVGRSTKNLNSSTRAPPPLVGYYYGLLKRRRVKKRFHAHEAAVLALFSYFMFLSSIWQRLHHSSNEPFGEYPWAHVMRCLNHSINLMSNAQTAKVIRTITYGWPAPSIVLCSLSGMTCLLQTSLSIHYRSIVRAAY